MAETSGLLVHQGETPADPNVRARMAEKPGSIAFNSEGETQNVFLWDQVTQGWAGPYESGFANSFFLQKQVVMCSACRDTTLLDKQMRPHVTAAIKRYQEHEGAEMMSLEGERGQILSCTGCDDNMHTPRIFKAHIERLKKSYETHMSAGTVEALLINQFTLSPSVALNSQVVDIIVLDERATQASEDERSGAPAKRRRRRRRRRSKG